MNKVTTIPVGTKLYHSSSRKLTSGMPNSPNGNWFATNVFDSVIHITRMTGKSGWHLHPMYVYVYETTKDLNVLLFENQNNSLNFAKKMPSHNSSQWGIPYYNMARFLCSQNSGRYNGWSMPNDQSQVMLCKPHECIKFVKVTQLKFVTNRPYNINFRKSYERQKIIDQANKVYNYKLVNIPYNNLTNSRLPPTNAVYSIGSKFYSSNGRNLANLNKNSLKRGFTLNGVRKIARGDYFRMYNGNQLNIIKSRIKAKTGVDANYVGDLYIHYIKNMPFFRRVCNKFSCLRGN